MLRFFLALSVLQSHIWHQSPFYGFGGSTSVEIFFVISGFYISSILSSKYTDLPKFYLNRVLRLYPQYFIILGFIAFKLVIFPETRENLFAFPVAALCLGALANLTFIGSDWLMFFKINAGNISFGNFQFGDVPIWHVLWVPQIWSLGIEIAFYCIAPYLTRLSTKQISIIAFTLLSFRFVGLFTVLKFDPWTYRFFPFELPLFITGILIQRKKRIINEWLIRLPKFIYSLKAQRLLILSSFIICGLLPSLSEFGRLCLVSVLILIVVIPVLAADWPSWDRKIGELSYPIYISHMFVIATLSSVFTLISNRGYFVDLQQSGYLWNFLQLFCVGLFSLFLYFATKPIENIRNRIRAGARVEKID